MLWEKKKYYLQWYKESNLVHIYFNLIITSVQVLAALASLVPNRIICAKKWHVTLSFAWLTLSKHSMAI